MFSWQQTIIFENSKTMNCSTIHAVKTYRELCKTYVKTRMGFLFYSLNETFD